MSDGLKDRPAPRWWHAYGRVREDLDGAHQLVVIGPATEGPEAAGALAPASWGDYLRSWDHEPSQAEKDAVTPSEFLEE